MGTRLHSIETYLYKYLLPIMFVPWDGFRGLRRAFPANDPRSAGMWFVLVAWSVMFPLVVFYALKLRTVVLDENVLHVRSYVKAVDVPIANIATINRPNFFKRHVTLRLKGDSEFGTTIMFFPKRRILTDAGYRYTLDELQERIDDAAQR